MQFAWGYAAPLIIESALKYRVFDLLDQSAKTVAQLAKESDASERGLTAVLDALVGLQLLGRAGENYTLTPESAAFLVSSKPSYQGSFFAHISTQLMPKWMQLPDVVRTGKPAAAVNDQKQGAEFFVAFVEALFPMSYAAAKTLGEHLGVAKAQGVFNVLDIAAGSGVWGIAVAQQSPNVRIHAVDWPQVLDVTESVARKHGVGDRLTKIPGDLLTVDFGKNHQLATLGHILHSEGRERSRQLLKKTFDALAPGGTIAVMEFVPNDDRTGPPVPLLFGVNMLINTESGDVFTFAEMSQWLRDVGFVNPRLLQVPAVSPLVLATKP